MSLIQLILSQSVIWFHRYINFKNVIYALLAAVLPSHHFRTLQARPYATSRRKSSFSGYLWAYNRLIHIYIYTYTCAYIHVYIYLFTYIPICMPIYVYTFAYIPVYSPTYFYAFAYKPNVEIHKFDNEAD